MGPDITRKRKGFVGLGVAPLALFAAPPALAQTGTAALALPGFVPPLAAVLGAGACALLAVAVLRQRRADEVSRARRMGAQVAGLRAQLDDYEALFAGMREVTVLWPEGMGEARILGQAGAVLPAGRRPDSVLKFSAWLKPDHAERLARLVEGLRIEGRGFETSLVTADGRTIRAAGWVPGGGTALRLRPVFRDTTRPEPAGEPGAALRPDPAGLRTLLSMLTKPAFMRDAEGLLVFANPAYQRLATALGRKGTETAPAELMERDMLARHAEALRAAEGPVTLPLSWPGEGSFELVEFPLEAPAPGGTAGYLRPAGEGASGRPAEAGLAHVAGTIDVLTIPIAIFNARRELVQFNRAYADLWGLDPRFLVPGLDERAILDKLRTEGRLPPVPDYHAWRRAHLSAYELDQPREDDPWHLPDGRSLRVVAAPAGPKGGVIYVFEDITERLMLESTNKAFFNVQRESLNALSEGVAVFGTNGRLTLSNPRLSELWKLPEGGLGESPHIDEIARACAGVMPEDGARIWADLKRRIVDLDPHRADTAGRIERADGRILDYAATRLPDGQTMMSFLDVTESAQYSQLLKERNEALVAADQLKDAFIQNVSYELRSPLTNIIGFADLLAADGENLTEKQRSYTDYIRASSMTLGVLIDNILDLANVDAGIAELKPERLDAAGIVEKARAGLSATFAEVGGEKPLNLVVDIAEGLPSFVADGTRMVQILYNLLSNAARFSPPGGEIRLGVRARGERILFTIEDEGPGLPDPMKQMLHARLDSPTGGGRMRGAGLGLVIVRAFVNLHGGVITAEKREPRGSRITVNLPREAALAGAAE